MSAASVARRPRTTTGQNIGSSPVKETVKFVCLLEPKGILEPQNWRGAYHALQGDLNKIEVEFTKKKLDGEHRASYCLMKWDNIDTKQVTRQVEQAESTMKTYARDSTRDTETPDNITASYADALRKILSLAYNGTEKSSISRGNSTKRYNRSSILDHTIVDETTKKFLVKEATKVSNLDRSPRNKSMAAHRLSRTFRFKEESESIMTLCITVQTPRPDDAAIEVVTQPNWYSQQPRLLWDLQKEGTKVNLPQSDLLRDTRLQIRDAYVENDFEDDRERVKQ
ncbi:hypothetical protein ACJA88_014835 [Fusarium oxysporum]